MINILVVDDDPFIRQSICIMLKEHYQQKEITIYEASDGLKALELISTINVHILLTDIKMPNCTGIELLKKLKAFHFRGKSIVLSGFDDYSLVREAMKFGATDYLLKPIVTEEFFTLFDNTLQEITEQESYIANHEDEAMIDIRKLYENQFKLDRLFAEGEPFNVKKGQCIMLMVELPRKEMTHLEFVKSSYFSQCLDYFNWHIEKGYELIQGEYQGCWIVLLEDVNDSALEQIQPFLADFTNRDQKACCSDFFSMEYFKQAYADCLRRMDNIFYNIPKLPPITWEAYPYTEHILTLETAVCNYDYPAFSDALHELMLQINYDKCPVSDIRRLLLDFVYRIMQKNSRYIRTIGQYKMSENDILLGISEAFCLSQLQDEFMKDFQLYMNAGDSDEGVYIRKAKQYIAKHYVEDISLNDIASALSLHPNYFSSLFRKSCQMTLMEYIRDFRIKKACELMDHTNLKLYEIAEQVGYHDTVSFNRAFNKVTNLSPSEYRKGLPLT